MVNLLSTTVNAEEDAGEDRIYWPSSHFYYQKQKLQYMKK